MKVVVCIASHERPVPLNIVLRCLPKSWHAVVVVSSEEDKRAIAARQNTHAFIWANQPLGAKWQHAVDQARKLEPDLLLITGSDDVLIADEEVLIAAMGDHDFVGLNSFHIYDGNQHHKCRYIKPGHIPIGGGRVYGRSLLEKMRWNLFDPMLSRKLDQYGFHNAQRAGGKILHVEDMPGLKIIALKGPWQQLNSLDKLRAHPDTISIIPQPHVRHFGDYQF